MEAYQKGDYGQALEHFQRLVEFPLNQRTSAAQLMLGKTFFKLEEYVRALEMTKLLEQRFAQSRYLPHARLLAGDCYYGLHRYYEAAFQYGRVLATVTTLGLQAQAAEQMAAIVENKLISAEGIERMGMGMGADRLQEALLFGRARWYQRLDWKAQSQAAMQNYLETIPDGIFATLVKNGDLEALTYVPTSQSEPSTFLSSAPPRTPVYHEGGRPRLGLLLPLSGIGFQRQVGEDLLAGVQLANEQLGDPCELVVADISVDYGDLQIEETESSRLLRVVHKARKLIEQEGVVAIIGPVFSSDCVAAAVVAEAAGVPLIAPLAQQSGLDQLGGHIFQIHPIPEVQARILAEYATLVLGLRTLAIIAPLTDYGWNFEQEFTRVAYANGGEMVHVDWYFPEVTKDFRRIFEDIRQVGFGITPPPRDEISPSAAHTLTWTVTDSSISGRGSSFLNELQADLEENLIEKKRIEGIPTDSSEIFIDTIDGIAIVVESFEDAKTIAPQLHFYRLQTQIIGNDIWYEPEAIRQMRPRERSYIEGAIFVSGHQETDPGARIFIEVFRRRFARDPGYAAYGYDAARLVMGGWQQGLRIPGRLREWLAQQRDFDGASGWISFVPGRRTNVELSLLMIDQQGQVRTLEHQDLPDLILPAGVLPSPVEADLPLTKVQPEESGREE